MTPELTPELRLQLEVGFAIAVLAAIWLGHFIGYFRGYRMARKLYAEDWGGALNIDLDSVIDQQADNGVASAPAPKVCNFGRSTMATKRKESRKELEKAEMKLVPKGKKKAMKAIEHKESAIEKRK
jgi:hypothetical protein